MNVQHGTKAMRVSQRKRKRVEEVFGWMKTVALQRKTRFRGLDAGGLDVHLRGCRLQPGADAQSSDRQTPEEKCVRTAKNTSFRPRIPLRGADTCRLVSPKTASAIQQNGTSGLFQQPAKSSERNR